LDLESKIKIQSVKVPSRYQEEIGMRNRKARTERKFPSGFLSRRQAVREKPIQFAAVMTIGFWALFVCIPAVFITQVNRALLLGGGFLYCAVLSFMSVGLCQFDFVYRYSRWAKRHRKGVIILTGGLLFLGSLLYVVCKMSPESMMRPFLWLAAPMEAILVIVLLSIVGASIAGWIEYIRGVRRRPNGQEANEEMDS
jgi:hypothetical protein